MVSLVVLASGSGTNFQALIDAIKQKKLSGVEIRALITNNPEAKAIERAKRNNIPVEILDPKQFSSREEYDDLCLKPAIDKYSPDYVFLLGYMLVVKGPKLLSAYRWRMINLHPSLLPSFPGLHAGRQALDYGCKVAGITLHFVDNTLDGGPIIYQACTSIEGCSTEDEVMSKLHQLEYEGVVKVADMLSKGVFVVKGRRTYYKKGSA